jgi:hypothetical protein
MQKMAKVSGKEKRYISENIKYKGAFLCPAYAVFFETRIFFLKEMENFFLLGDTSLPNKKKSEKILKKKLNKKRVLKTPVLGV